MSAVQWYVARHGQKVGPFTAGELKQMAAAGLLQPNEHIWTQGMKKWLEASRFAVLFPKAGQKRFWLSLEGKTRGPFYIDQLRASLASRQITPDALVCPEGGSQWVALVQVTELAGTAAGGGSSSQAQLLAGTLDAEEAELYLAGKSGDVFARLISTLTELKKTYADNPTLLQSLDHSIEVLKEKRSKA